jgi:hypothetical protein
MEIAMGAIPRKPTRGKFNQALARSPVFELGEWDVAEWTADTTLAEMVLAVIHAPDESERTVRLEVLARQPLFVSMPRAVPEVRAVLAALRRTPQGRFVYREAYPRFCLYAARWAWEDVQSVRDATDAERAAHFHARAMRHMVALVLSLKGAPAPTDALARLGPLSTEEAARIDELFEASPSGPVQDGALELVEAVADTLQYTRPRDRDRALTEVLVEELLKSFAGTWRAKQRAMLARQATMLGCTRGALRMRNLRRKLGKKRDAPRKDAACVKSKT